MEEQYKKRFGDRRDARWVRDVPGLTTVMMHIMPQRTDAEVYLNDKIDVTELLQYLEKKNADLNQQYETEKKAATEMIRRYDAVLSEIKFKGIQRSEENELAKRLPIMTSQQKHKIVDVIRNFMNVKHNGLVDRLKSEGLSDRNIELVSLKAFGMSSKTIASLLGYKDAESVYVTISRIIKRLDANSFNHLIEKFSDRKK